MITRLITEADLLMLLEHRNDPSTRKWLGNDQVISAEAHRQWYRSASDLYRIVVNNNGQDVGLTRLNIDIDAVRAWVGADVFRAHRGKGLGRSIFAVACERAMMSAKIKKLCLKVFMANIPAITIYRSAGFKFDTSIPLEFYMRDDPIMPNAYATMFRKV